MARIAGLTPLVTPHTCMVEEVIERNFRNIREQLNQLDRSGIDGPLATRLATIEAGLSPIVLGQLKGALATTDATVVIDGLTLLTGVATLPAEITVQNSFDLKGADNAAALAIYNVTGENWVLAQVDGWYAALQAEIAAAVAPYVASNYAGVIEPTGISSTIVQWDANQVDEISTSDAANDRVTAGADGDYELFGGLSMSETGGSAAITLTLNFDINGGGPLVFGHTVTVPISGSAMASIFHRVTLSSGDHVRLIATTSGGTPSADAGWLAIKQVS